MASVDCSDIPPETFITERSRAFMDAYNKGDAERLVSDYFAQDRYQPAAYPPGQPPVTGRAALIALFRDQMRGAPRIRLETINIAGSEHMAFEVGRAHLGLADGGMAVGRYTVCWIVTGQGWRAKADFFATDGWADAPPSPPR